MSVPSSKSRWLMPILWIGCALCVLHAVEVPLATVCRAETGKVDDSRTAQPAGSSEPVGVPAAPDSAGEQAAPNDRDAKRRAVSIGFLGLMGIVLSGLGLLVLVIVWGHRIRRISRSSPPQTTLGDELWYLRPDKPAPPASSNHSDEHGEQDPRP